MLVITCKTNITHLKIKDSVYINPDQKNALNRLKRNNITTFAQMIRGRMIHNIGAMALDLHNIYHSFPKSWTKFYNKTTKIYDNAQQYEINVGINKWVNRSRVTAAQIRARLQIDNSSDATSRVSDAHGIVLSIKNNPFITLRKVTNISQLRIMQYKSLLNFYPTKVILSKWGLAENDRCLACNSRETVAHVTLDCDIAKDTYKELQIIIDGVNLHSCYKPVLTREVLVTLFDLPPDLATLLIVIKACLLKQKDNKRILNQQAILALMEDQYKLEYRIAYNTNSVLKHSKKWAYLRPILVEWEVIVQ